MEIPIMGEPYTANRDFQNMEVPVTEKSNIDKSNMDDSTSKDLLNYFDFKEMEQEKLKSKLEHYAIIEYKINYESDCVEFLHDYLLIYMKKFLRHMARQTRRYNIDCPLLTSTKTIETKKSEEKEYPWEEKVVWKRLTPEEIKLLKMNDEKEKILELMNKNTTRSTSIQLKKSILDYKLDLLNNEKPQIEEKAEKTTEIPSHDTNYYVGKFPYKLTTRGDFKLKVILSDDKYRNRLTKYKKFKMPVDIKKQNMTRIENVFNCGKPMLTDDRSFQSANQVPSSLLGSSRCWSKESNRKKGKEERKRGNDDRKRGKEARKKGKEPRKRSKEPRKRGKEPRKRGKGYRKNIKEYRTNIEQLNTRYITGLVQSEPVKYDFKVQDLLELIQDDCYLIPSRRIAARLGHSALQLKYKSVCNYDVEQLFKGKEKEVAVEVIDLAEEGIEEVTKKEERAIEVSSFDDFLSERLAKRKKEMEKRKKEMERRKKKMEKQRKKEEKQRKKELEEQRIKQLEEEGMEEKRIEKVAEEYELGAFTIEKVSGEGIEDVSEEELEEVSEDGIEVISLD